MDGDGFAPRRESNDFPVDSDGPPPRKKVSRFFPGGKSLIGSLPGKNRNASESSENTTPLIEDDAYTVQRQHHAKLQHQASNAASIESLEAPTTGFTGCNGPAQSSAQLRAAAPSKNRFSQAATALKSFSIRDRRRDGIVGIESLQRGANISDTTHISMQGSEFVVGQPTNPYQSAPFQAGPLPSHSVVPMTHEDRVRLQAAYGNGCTRSPRSPRSPQEDRGPLNAPPPQLKSSLVAHNDANFQQPFLPRPVATGVDLDRDVAGKKLPAQALRPIQNLPGRGITKLPQHATLTPTRRVKSIIPPTFYTSPDRIERAIHYSLKRKRLLLPPPPAFTYQHTNDPNFNIFSGILLYPELVFHLASILPIRDLISLYAISRDFHTILDTRFTTVMLSQSLRKCPESSRTFSFRCYAHLCRRDPAARIPHPNATLAAQGKVRLIPSFRWLKFLMHREKVVHEIMALFAEDGVPLPKRCSLALKRMWFILDIPDNARRIGFIHNVHLFTDLDLYFGMCFFVKLDMRLNDPVGQYKKDGMRKLLLAQESFTTVLKVLRRDLWAKQIDVMKAWIRYKYDPLEDEGDMPIFGVPAKEIGALRWEYWGRVSVERLKRKRQLLLRPDQLIMREAVKRGLRFHKHFLRCLTYGYVRIDTLEDYAPREMGRRKDSLRDEYEVDDEIGGLTFSMEKAGLEDGMDGDVLDLGERKSVSLLCIEGGDRSMIGPEERRKMEEEGMFLEACMQWSEAERADGDVDVRMLLV